MRVQWWALGIRVDERLRNQIKRHGLAAEEPFVDGWVDDVPQGVVEDEVDEGGGDAFEALTFEVGEGGGTGQGVLVLE